MVPIDPLIKVLGVECGGGAGGAGDDRNCNQGGQDGLHDLSPRSFPYPLQCGRECVVALFAPGRCSPGNTLASPGRSNKPAPWAAVGGLSGPVLSRP